jgi:hypothetical protein
MVMFGAVTVNMVVINLMTVLVFTTVVMLVVMLAGVVLWTRGRPQRQVTMMITVA